jgi:hypothetical protein
MSDSLRIRIAKVLYEDGQRPMATAARLADAVIRELGLIEEESEWPFDGKHRYVTEWQTTDE